VNNAAISAYDPQHLVIMRRASPNATEGGLLSSTDRGVTWAEKLPTITFSALSFPPEKHRDIHLHTFYLRGGMEEDGYKTNDGGNNWDIVPIDWTSMSNNSIQALVFHPNNSDKIILLEENEIVLSNDGGQTWENHVYDAQDFETDYYYGLSASYNPFSENQVIISANYYPFISEDGGITIEKFKSPFINSTGRMAVY